MRPTEDTRPVSGAVPSEPRLAVGMAWSAAWLLRVAAALLLALPLLLIALWLR